MALCEKCETEPGAPFTFLYGKSTSTSETRGTTTTTTTTYEVLGNETAVVGDRCIAAHRRSKMRFWVIWTAVGAIITAVGFAVFPSAEGENDPRQLMLIVGIIGASILVSGLGFLWEHGRHRGREWYGEEIGIEVHKARLEAEGFDNFWTQKGWENTKRSLKKG